MQCHLSFSSHTLLGKPLSPLRIPPRFPRTRTVVSAAATTNRQQAVMGSSRTMYELLAVTETADSEEIKSAYRRLARQWHPDTCRTADEKEKEFFAQQFMRAHEAYRVLSDPVLREDYDYELRSTGNEGIVFGKMRRSGGGYGDWEAQLEGLKKRSSSTSWGSRMRSAGRSSSSGF